MVLLSGIASPVSADTASVRTVYSSIPANLPGNVSSVGFESLGTSEFGDAVGLAAGGRRLRTLTVVFTSGACQARLAGNVCVTTPGATFNVPITASIYAVDSSSGSPEPGALITSIISNVAIPFRPSQDDVRCTGPNTGNWFSAADNQCFTNLAVKVTFALPLGVTLPTRVVWTVAFNTTHSGYHPIGTSAPCFTSSGGCGYDSLNIGVRTFPGSPFVGIDLDPDGVILFSNNSGLNCGGPTDVLRLATPCWTGLTPLGAIAVAAPIHVSGTQMQNQPGQSQVNGGR